MAGNEIELVVNVGFDKATATIIASSITAVVALVSMFITKSGLKQQKLQFENQLKHQNKQYEKEKTERLIIFEMNLNKNYNDERLKHIKKTYHLLSKIRSKCSYTRSYIETINDDKESFNALYADDIVGIINEIQMNVGLYFPELSIRTEEINSKANLFWGNQQQYMRKDIGQSSCDSSLQIVLNSSNEIYKLSKSMQYDLKKEFDNIINKQIRGTE